MTNSEHRGPSGMRREARISWLQETVNQSGPVHIRVAAENLNVSEMTVRRDVRDAHDTLQFLGGYVVLAQDAPRRAPYDLSDASGVNAEAKRAACLACLPLLRSDDTLFVDCGTTLPHLIHAIPNDLKLTVICYAMNIADLVVRKANIQLVMLGGVYHPPTASFYPTQEDATLDAYAINLALMSAAGVDSALGVTCTSFREARLKQLIMGRAQRNVLVVDSSKFGQAKSARFADFGDFSWVATEKGLAEPEC